MKVSIFPKTHDVDTLLRNKDILSSDIILGELASFPEDGICEEQYLDVPVARSCETFATETECVLIPPDIAVERLVRFPAYIQKAAKMNRKIVFTTEQQKRELNISGNNIFVLQDALERDAIVDETWHSLYRFPVPIIAIASMGEQNEKFAIQLELKRFFDNSSYRALHICANALGKLFGMQSMPEWVFGNQLTFAQKVYATNAYVWRLYQQHRPDVIVISIPGGVIRFPNNSRDQFSEIAHVFSHALEVDATVFATYLDMDFSEEEALLEMVNYIQYCYGLPVYMFVLSDVVAKKSENEEQYEYYHVGDYIAQPVYQSQVAGIPVVYVKDRERIRFLLQEMLTQMEDGISSI